MPGSHSGEGAQHTPAPGEGSEGQAATFPHEQWEERGGCRALEAAPTHPARYHAPQAAAQSRCSKTGRAERKRQQISRGRATASAGRHAQDGLALTVTPIRWGTCGDEAVATTATSTGAEAAAIRSQLLDTGQGLDNHFQTAAAGDGERVDLQARSQGLAQGRTSVSKVTLWYRAPGRFGPAGQGASDRQGEVCKPGTRLWLRKVTAREAMPRRNLPFLQGTNLPRNTTAGKTTLPKPLREEGSPVGNSLFLVNSSLLRAPRKTQPAAR